MNEMPDLEVVYQALGALYHDPDPSGKERASQWLGDLQKSVFAWKVADALLHQKRDMESCYFGAQTLRTKIQYSFHELPQEAHDSLRDSMFEHISQINEHSNTVIATQLCLGLADLLLQMASWKTPIQDLIERFGPWKGGTSLNAAHLWPLLEVLTVLPEEMGSRTLRLGAVRRSELMKMFTDSVHRVLQLLDMCLSIQSSDRLIGVRILRCFSSWVKLEVAPLNDLASSMTLMNIFTILNNYQSSPLVHEAASDAVCAFLQIVGEHSEDEDYSKSEPSNSDLRCLQDNLAHSIRTLEKAYHLAVAEEDTEKAFNYCRVFTELCEALMPRLLSYSSGHNNNGASNHNVLELLDLVLVCVGHHDYEVAEVTFGMWYRLSEALYHFNDDERTARFRPYIERLITGLCRHSQMEPDHEGVLEDGDDFYDFRTRVSELVKDVAFIVGSASVFRHCFMTISGQNHSSWEVSEAALFIMQAVAKNILPEENEIVPQVMEAVLQVPPTAHPAVKLTSIQLLGELCEWIDKHPNVIEPVLHHLLRSINEPALGAAVAVSLGSICSMCKTLLTPQFTVLLHLVENLPNFQLSSKAAEEIIKGVSQVCSQLPQQQVSEAVMRLCNVHVEALKHISQGQVSNLRGHSDPVYWLDRLTSVFRHLDISVSGGQQHPCLGVVTEMWPILSAAADKFQADRRIMERYCRCLRYALRLLGKHSAPLLSPLVQQMVAVYRSHHHSCFLYLGSILVDEYGAEQQYVSGLMDMLEALLPAAFHLLNEPQGFCQHPDTVDDLFRLCLRFLQRCPGVFLRSEAVTAILQCAIQASVLDHRDAHTSVMKFLAELVHRCRSKDKKVENEIKEALLQNVIKPRGYVLVSTLITASLFTLSTCSLPDVGEVLLELLNVDQAIVSVWLEQTVRALPTQSPSGCVAAEPHHLQEFHKSCVNAKTAKEMSNVLRDFARLYR